MRGREAIDRLCGDVLTAEDLFEVRAHTEPETYEAVEGGSCLILKIQGASREEVSVLHRDMDIEVKLHNFNRCIPLPNTLRGAEMTKVDVEDDLVRVTFRLKEGGEQ